MITAIIAAILCAPLIVGIYLVFRLARMMRLHPEEFWWELSPWEKRLKKGKTAQMATESKASPIELELYATLEDMQIECGES
jgi:hypothetical protein